jgi:hypothetical protein
MTDVRQQVGLDALIAATAHVAPRRIVPSDTLPLWSRPILSVGVRAGESAILVDGTR